MLKNRLKRAFVALVLTAIVFAVMAAGTAALAWLIWNHTAWLMGGAGVTLFIITAVFFYKDIKEADDAE